MGADNGEDSKAEAVWEENTQTVMMRNLPNKYSQRMLIDEIEDAGFSETYDFLYLPVDPESNANRGYAFLNFIEASNAKKFRDHYEGTQMKRFNSTKVVSVKPATLQGFDANYAYYSRKRVNHGDPDSRPIFLKEGDFAAMKAAGQGLPRKRRRKGGGKGDDRQHEGDDSGNGDSVLCRRCGSTIALHLGFYYCAVCRTPVYY
mmetsp:Transcript_33999/g.54267  ORF Transcript_33999/g.54267 Transcript_33999/m.54267 type:complete len:203 (+) Transcript_33999:64-672(+)